MKTVTFLLRLTASLFIVACFIQTQIASASGMATSDLLVLAEGNNSMAQRVMGERFATGTYGVNKNMNQAVFWWQKAAERGDVMAQYYLGQIYRRGVVVLQDWVKAHMWFSLAETSNSKAAPAQYKKVAENDRKATEANMTPEQIKAAQALAQEWRETHKK